MFCLDMGWKEDEEAVEAREGVCSMTDIVPSAGSRSWRCRPDAQLGVDGGERNQRVVEAVEAVEIEWPFGVEASGRLGEPLF